MKQKILVVDGSNLLFQMFFGMPARIYNSQGIGIWGVLGFTGALLKIIRQVSPSHVCVLFDGEHENQRSVIDSDYKANRVDYSHVDDSENPFSQLPYIYQALEYIGIAYAETESCEVDDWICSYAKLYGGDSEMVISSFDSDFFQLISKHVTVLRYRGDKSVLCTPEYLMEKFGIEPCQYTDFKSLTGDASDNIPGADKVGPKTAAALLREFGSLENIIQNASSIKKASIRDSIIRNRERLRRNYALICLDKQGDVPFTLEQMRFCDPGITTTQVLQAIGLK